MKYFFFLYSFIFILFYFFFSKTKQERWIQNQAPTFLESQQQQQQQQQHQQVLLPFLKSIFSIFLFLFSVVFQLLSIY